MDKLTKDLTKDPDLTDILKGMVLVQKLDPDKFQFQNIPSTKHSPKCKNYNTGSLSDKVVMFLEHFYTAVTGEFEEFKHSQRAKSRSWREGETEYVTPDSQTDWIPASGIKHVLDSRPDTKTTTRHPSAGRLSRVPRTLG